MTNERDDTTITSSDDDDIAAAVQRVVGSRPSLTIIWSAHEPQRVGESAVLEGRKPWSIGRDSNQEGAALFAPRTPGRSQPGIVLSGEAISRRQLQIDSDENGARRARNVGKGTVRVNGVPLEREAEQPLTNGDVVTIAGRYALLVGERSADPPMQFPYPSTHAFGEADAFGIVGESRASWALRERLAAAADARTHVLVLGETGAGKELAARAIHELSEREGRTFLARNVSTMDEGVFAAEIFGCARNFPNAGSPERVGLVGAADGGTLMLDEIGTIPNSLQAKLLTYLDAGSYFRVGDERERHADVLVIGATNSAVSDLKNDLGPRFKVKVGVPSLAARREDIPLLARHLVLGIAAKSKGAQRFVVQGTNRAEVRMSCAFVTWLVRRSYPGNTRELEEVLRDAMFASAGDTIELEVDANHAPSVDEEDHVLSEVAVRAALKQCGGNQTQAAVMLGVSRYAVRRLIAKHGIDA